MEMTATCSSITALHGLQVLLVESDQNSLQHHGYVLLQNSCRVTSTNKLSTGLSMIVNGNTFDCVLVDAENFEMEMVHFIHHVLKHQPKIPIIAMAGNDFQLLMAKQTLTNEAIWFLRKPCEVSEICNLLQHVCTRRINFIDAALTGKPLQENQDCNAFHMLDAVVRPSAILNTTMINNNISLSNGSNLGLNVNSQKYVVMSKSLNYVDISDDDEPTTKENIFTGRAKNIDKGKKRMDLKRKNDQPVMDHISREKRKDITPRTAWTRALHGNFMEAYPKENQMSVPRLTSEHVGSHLQIFQERENNIKKPNLAVPFQKGYNLQVESYGCKRFGLSTPSNNDASIKQQSSSLLCPLKLNSTGISFMTIGNIKAKLHGAPPLYLPQLNNTTTINNSRNEVSNHSFGDPFTPLLSEISMSNAFGLTANPDNGTAQGIETFSNNYSFGDLITPLVAETSMCNAFGLAENPSIETFSNNHTLEEVMAPPGINSTIEPDYTMGVDSYNFSNCFANGDYGGAGGRGVSETLAQLDRFGIAIDSYGGGVADLSNHGLKDSTFQESISYDMGGVNHPQDFQGNGETLFDVVNSANLSFSNSDSLTFGHASAGFLHPSIPVEENSNQTEIQQHVNSIVSVDGSEGKAIDDDWYMKMMDT